MANPFETQARLRKALALADALRGVGVRKAEAMTQDERDALAARAGQRSPSPTTWEMAVGFYAEKVGFMAQGR